MLFLICGKDQYRARQKLKELIEKHSAGSTGSLLDLFFQKTSINDLKKEIENRSLFGGKKLIVLVNALEDKDFQTGIMNQKNTILKDKNNIIIFFEERDFSKNEKIFSFFKEQGDIFNFLPLTPEQNKEWIKKRFFSLGFSINPETINALEDHVGNDLWHMSLEIKKLCAYRMKDKKINKEDIESLVAPKIEVAIFKTIDAIANKDKKKALLLIQKHLEKGESPFYILSMIVFQFRNLLVVKEMEDSGLSLSDIILKMKKTHPFVVKKSYVQGKVFTFLRLKEIYLKIFKIDLAAKTGKIKPELALELLVADI